MKFFFFLRRRPFKVGTGGLLVVVGLQVALAADFLEIYRLAQGNDQIFAGARETLAALEQRLPQARAGLLPTIWGESNENRNQTSSSFSGADPLGRNIRSWDWTLKLTQPVFRAQSYFAYTEAESVVEQAVANFAQAEQELILRAAQAYFDVVVAEESISVAEAKLKAMGEQLAIASRGYELGTATVTDVHESRARVDLARADLVAARNELVAKRAELDKVVGDAPRTLFALRADVVAPRPQPDDERAWVDQARENNPAVQAGRAAYSAAESAVNKNRSDHLPTLEFSSSLGRNYVSGTTFPNDYTTLGRSAITGVKLIIPVFAGGGTNSKVAEAIANCRKTLADLENTRRKAAADARQAFAAVANGLAQIEAMTSAVESGAVAVKGNQIGYRVGIRINVDVLNAEQQLYASKRDLTKVRYETLLQGLKLKAAAGVLGEEDVLAINALLGPRGAEGAPD